MPIGSFANAKPEPSPLRQNKSDLRASGTLPGKPSLSLSIYHASAPKKQQNTNPLPPMNTHNRLRLFAPVRTTDGFRGLPTISFTDAQEQASKLGLAWAVALVYVDTDSLAKISPADMAAFHKDMDQAPRDLLTADEIEDMAHNDETARIESLSAHVHNGLPAAL